MGDTLTGLWERSSASGWILVILAAIAIWRQHVIQRPKMKELEIGADEALLGTTIERLNRVENALEQQRAVYEVRIEQERVQHAAELAVMRHRIANLDQCLTMLLMLIEQDPDKARDAASRVRQMRERQEAAEAAEKGAVHAAAITSAATKKGADK